MDTCHGAEAVSICCSRRGFRRRASAVLRRPLRTETKAAEEASSLQAAVGRVGAGLGAAPPGLTYDDAELGYTGETYNSFVPGDTGETYNSFEPGDTCETYCTERGDTGNSFEPGGTGETYCTEPGDTGETYCTEPGDTGETCNKHVQQRWVPYTSPGHTCEAQCTEPRLQKPTLLGEAPRGKSDRTGAGVVCCGGPNGGGAFTFVADRPGEEANNAGHVGLRRDGR